MTAGPARPGELEALFRQPPAIHRFPGAMAKRVHDLCAYIAGEYDGHAERVWTEATDANDLELRIRAMPGFGDMKVLALSAVLAKRFGVEAAKPLAWLEKNSRSWAAQSGPAAYAQLIFAAHATGTNPRDFGGVDLVKQLGSSGPEGWNATVTDTAVPSKEKEQDEDGGVSVWWIIGVGLAGGMGIGFLISSRNKKQPKQ